MRAYLLLGALVFLVPSVRAQAALAVGGGPGSDVGQKVAAWRDATTYAVRTAVVGEFEQTARFGSLSVTSADAPAARSDVFLVVYGLPPDPAAAPVALWARRMGTNVFNDFAGDVAFDPETGDVLVSGYFTGIATFDGGANPTLALTTRSDFDAFLARYSPRGDLLWVRQAGGTQQDLGRGLAVGVDGAIYWTGTFTGSGTFGAGATAVTLESRGGSADGFLARYTPAGDLVWARALGGTSSDDARDVALVRDDSRDPVVVGTFRGVAFVGGTAVQSRGLADVYVARFSPEGSLRWVQTFGGAGNDLARALDTSSKLSGDLVFVTGSFEETMLVGQTVLESAGFSDVFVAELNASSGALVQGARAGGAGFDIGNDIVAYLVPDYDIRSQALAVTGTTNGPASFVTFEGAPATLPGRGFDDGFLWTWRPDAAPLSPPLVYALGGSNADRGYGIAAEVGRLYWQTSDLHLTGVFRDLIEAAGATAPGVGPGTNDVYLARLSGCSLLPCPVSVEAPPEARAVLRVHGTPGAHPRAVLLLTAPAEVSVDLVDALGRVQPLRAGALGAGETRIALPAGLAAGVYVVRVRGGVEARAVASVTR